MHDYQRTPVLTLLDPEKDPLGAGYHILQSKIAIGSGGLSGKGWMQGTQSQLEFCAEPHTDFIFAVMGEEHGMIGFLILMAIYFYYCARFNDCRKCSNFFWAYSCWCNNINFLCLCICEYWNGKRNLPVVGVPLPLFSYGGTSYVAIMAVLVLLMSIHTHKSQFMKRANFIFSFLKKE